MITLIVAVADDGAIGKDGNLLWHLPGDLKRFKEITMGHTVVMGRKTWESLPRRPLPGRTNIVISRNPHFRAPGAIVVSSPEAALTEASGKEEDFFVIGGESIYRAALPAADAIDLTRVYARFEDADARFPLPDPKEWQTVWQSELLSDPRTGLTYRHFLLRRR